MDFKDLDTSLKITRPNVCLYSGWLTSNSNRLNLIQETTRSSYITKHIAPTDSNPGAIISFLKKSGLVSSSLAASPLSAMIAFDKLSYPEFCMIHLSKQSMFLGDTPKCHFLSILCKYIVKNGFSNAEISVVRTLGEDLIPVSGDFCSNKRPDYIMTVLSGTGLFKVEGAISDGIISVVKGAEPIIDYLSRMEFENCEYSLNSKDRFDYFASTHGGILNFLNSTFPVEWNDFFPNINSSLFTSIPNPSYYLEPEIVKFITEADTNTYTLSQLETIAKTMVSDPTMGPTINARILLFGAKYCNHIGPNSNKIGDYIKKGSSYGTEISKGMNLGKILRDIIKGANNHTYTTNVNLLNQIIYYGAPGTGKSFKIKSLIAKNHITEDTNVFRTTFHPDTDYASFVGCYKPTERGSVLTKTIWDFASKTALEIPVMDVNDEPVIDHSITYRYVPQVFVNAYVRAWNLMGKVTASATGTAVSPAITIPSFTTSSCYAGKCAKGTPGLFECIGVEKLTDEERTALADVEAFKFPFDGYSSIGDLRIKKGVEVEIVDAPSVEQINNKSRRVVYKREEVEAEIQRLKDLLKSNEIDFNKYGDFIWMSIRRFEDILDKMGTEDEYSCIEAPNKLLGLYDKAANRVFLFINNIRDYRARNVLDILIATYIHEMFHAYFSDQNYIPAIEEAIVEGATLCFLEQYDNNVLMIYRWKVLEMCATASSFYGFGIELYERRSEDWVADYFHAPRINANDTRVNSFCGYFKLGYPFGMDVELVSLLYTILKSSPATVTTGGEAITNKDAVVLVVEEINRGNCAQIFGDLFQLLDRKNGFSEYPIKAEVDLRRYLESAKDEAGNDILTNKDGIKNGKLCLPPNLFIWATMNTSDQSLFPIDSAFKRRWDWEYVPINYEDAKQFTLTLDDKHSYNWSKVLKGLNTYIKKETASTNKLLGNRFVQPKSGTVIDAATFREKVLFFLFNDVFKDNDDFCQVFFKGHEELSFFEDLCESSDITTIINFVEMICGAKNPEKEDPAKPAETVETTAPAEAEEPEA